MFDDTYPIRKVTVTRAFTGEFHKLVTRYSFDSRAGERYLIDVTEYPDKFHTIDFFRKRFQYSRQKFTELTQEGDSSRILGTVVKHMAKLLEDGKAQAVCFGFIGARMEGEPEGAVSKRFRVYRKMMEFLISPVTFEHLMDEHIDAYVILKRSADRASVLATARHAFAKENEEE